MGEKGPGGQRPQLTEAEIQTAFIAISRQVRDWLGVCRTILNEPGFELERSTKGEALLRIEIANKISLSRKDLFKANGRTISRELNRLEKEIKDFAKVKPQDIDVQRLRGLLQQVLDIVAPERKEFPPLTQRDLEEIHRSFLLLLRVQKKLSEFRKYTGLEEAPGEGGPLYNSRTTLYQFIYVLAMTQHPLVKEIVGRSKDNKLEDQLDAAQLVKAKIMQGMKILDLGCGIKPVFARCCRALGAQVWTVDAKPAVHFEFNRELFTREQREIELLNHININLVAAEAATIIQQKTGGNFNLAIEANLIADGFDEADLISMPLLKKGGVHVAMQDILSSKGEKGAILKE